MSLLVPAGPNIWTLGDQISAFLNGDQKGEQAKQQGEIAIAPLTASPMNCTLGAVAIFIHGFLSTKLSHEMTKALEWSPGFLPATAGGPIAFGALYALCHTAFFILIPSWRDTIEIEVASSILAGMGAIIFLQWSFSALLITMAAGTLVNLGISVLCAMIRVPTSKINNSAPKAVVEQSA